ncbi:hypothetical protein PS624_02028 [Pseudomonas fluorescens]|uniref:Autotransporter domain-containing protein n=1 Tax=Pseudomonas fluorescens TaxID=294 RepID=A0A5E6S3S0_PSEFL|nr:hypothetical protein PS624_02028 [Pseudomonas fluorescens]
MTFEPSLGFRVSHLDLNGFKEKGSELALDVDDNSATRRSAVANLNVAFAPVAMGAWQLVPSVQVGYERTLGDNQVDSQSHLLGLDIEQRAAFDNRDPFSRGVNPMASLGALSLGAEVGANGGGDSHGFNGGLKASYAFKKKTGSRKTPNQQTPQNPMWERACSRKRQTSQHQTD